MQRFFLYFVFFLSCTISSGFYEVEPPALFSLEIAPERQSSGDHLRCATDEECQSLILGSECEKNRCGCAGEKVLGSDGSKCLEPGRKFGCSCEDNVQCSHLLSAGGSCIENKCKCKPGYHYLRGFCWKNIGLDQNCSRGEQCFSDHEYIGLECSARRCGCREGYYRRLESGCRKIMGVDESCNLNSDCGGGAAGKCERRQCSQSAAFRNSVESPRKEGAGVLDREGQEGASDSELGTYCKDDSECNHVKNANCLGGVCGCEPPFYVASHDNSECLKVTLGQVEDVGKSFCKEDVQCGVFGGLSVCLDKKCACKDGSYWEKEAKFCWAVKSLGERCSDDRDCHPSAKHAECSAASLESPPDSGKVCRCRQGYHSKNDRCIADAFEVGDYCETDEECLFANSTCQVSSNACSCREHYFLKSGKCVAGIGSPCAADAECAHLANVYCGRDDSKRGRCSCLDDHAPSEGNDYCLPAVEYEGVCSESFQCKFHSGDFGECRGGICRCNGSAHYSRGRCYQSKFLGEACSRKQDCLAGNDENAAICLKGYCTCHHDYVSDDTRNCVRKNSGARPTLHWLLLAALPALLRP